ncbi:MAG: TolC family protein [FCB group bacterium]|nr:TolC family protein [FCB group bacterium]
MKLLYLILLSGVLAAAETISCNEAMDFALQHNPSVLQSEAGRQAAAFSLWSAASAHLPTATFGFTNIWNDREILFPVDSNIVAVIQPKSQWQKSVDVTLPLFTGGSLTSSTAITYYNNLVSRLTYEETRQAVRYKTLEAYYNLLKMQRILEVTSSAKELVDENIKLVQKMYDLGMVQKKDLLQARVSSTEIRQQIQQARQGERLSRISLNLTMGKPLNEEYELDDALAEPVLEISLEDLLSHALDNRSEFRSAQLGEKIARWGVRANQGALLPGVAGIFHWQQDSEPNIFSGNESWRAMLNVSFDLPFGLSNVAKVGEAKAQYRQTRYALKQAEDGIKMEVEANYLQYQLLQESLGLAEDQLAAAEENYQAVKAGYENGESSQLELIDARNSLIGARTNLINTKIDHYISYNKLMYSCGYPFGN